jgi:hypothetical protein
MKAKDNILPKLMSSPSSGAPRTRTTGALALRAPARSCLVRPRVGCCTRPYLRATRATLRKLESAFTAHHNCNLTLPPSSHTRTPLHAHVQNPLRHGHNHNQTSQAMTPCLSGRSQSTLS